MSLRVVFMGSPDFSVGVLKSIIEAGHEIVCVYSQPPRPAGRGKALRQTPVHAFAEARGVEVRTPKSLKSEDEQSAFAALGADIGVVVAYGLILPQAVLDAPKLGCLNIHASLLPRWRGAAPIQRAVMAGDEETGVDIMKMEAGLDTGPVMLRRATQIEPEDTAGDLHDRLAAMAAGLIVEALDQLEAGTASFSPQPEEGVVYAHKLNNDETRIDWAKPAREVRNHINGLSPFPGAWFELETGKGPVRVKALGARAALGEGEPGEALDDELIIACGEGAIRLTRLQRAGAKPMTGEEFLRGAGLPAGTMLR